MKAKALNFYEKMSKDPNLNQESVKLRVNNFTELDAEFILKYADANSNILDLGSGTGLIVNKIYDKVAKIVAVEPFQKFTDFIVKSQNIEVVNKTIDDYFTNEQFDLITAFGVMPYFNKEEAAQVYKKFKGNLKKKGGGGAYYKESVWCK